MGTLIRVIFREGVPRQRTANRAMTSRRSAIARERGLTLWREREDLVIAAAYRVAPQADTRSNPDSHVNACIPLKFAPQA
jgi:hypothetical protein